MSFLKKIVGGGVFSNILFRIRLKLEKDVLKKTELWRGKLFYLGKNVRLYTNHLGDPYLVSIEDNVSVAAEVRFINHDISCYNVARYLNKPEESFDSVGSIELHENCFVGAYSILMPNCSVGKNSIVASGSIVTKKIPDGEVWGGVPAKFIMTIDDYARKLEEKCNDYPWMGKTLSYEELVRERQDYFFNHQKVK